MSVSAVSPSCHPPQRVCVCVCVWGGGRSSEIERERETESERVRERERESAREREREREKFPLPLAHGRRLLSSHYGTSVSEYSSVASGAPPPSGELGNQEVSPWLNSERRAAPSVHRSQAGKLRQEEPERAWRRAEESRCQTGTAACQTP